MLNNLSSTNSPSNLKNDKCNVRWKHKPMFAAHWWSASSQITSFMYLGNLSLPRFVVAEHSVHNRWRLVSYTFVPRSSHWRILVPVGELVGPSLWWSKSDLNFVAWDFLEKRSFFVFFGVFVSSFWKVVKSSNLAASDLFTATYLFKNPPADSSCFSSSSDVLRKHTTDPGSSWIRETLVWFRQIFFPNDGTLVIFVGGFVIGFLLRCLYFLLVRVRLTLAIQPFDTPRTVLRGSFLTLFFIFFSPSLIPPGWKLALYTTMKLAIRRKIVTGLNTLRWKNK